MMSEITNFITLIAAIVIIWLIWRNQKKDNKDNLLETLNKLNEELDREGQIGELRQSLKALQENQLGHEGERSKLEDDVQRKQGEVNKLQEEIVYEQRKLSERLSNTSGSLNYGEIALERTLELSGLKKNIHYYSQQPIQDEDGNNLTNADGANLIPDITIRFPDNRYLYIDAKYPDKALIKLKEDKDNKKYSKSFKTLITSLGNDDYADRGMNTPGFCVMFVPGDHYILEAFKHDPEILEFGLERNIVIATPGTLFSIIKTVELSFRREQLNDKADQFYEDARKLVDTTEKFIDHFNDLESKIRPLTTAYNRAVKVLENDHEEDKGLLNQLREIEDKTIGKGLTKTKKIGNDKN